jgi:hypothetical protein
MTTGPLPPSLGDSAMETKAAIGDLRSDPPRQDEFRSTRRTRRRPAPSSSSTTASSDRPDRCSSRLPRSIVNGPRTTPILNVSAVEFHPADRGHARTATPHKQKTSRRRHRRRAANVAVAAHVVASEPSQAPPDDMCRELVTLHQAFSAVQRQLKKIEQELRSTTRRRASPGRPTSSSSRCARTETSSPPMHVSQRSFCWGELQGTLLASEHPVRAMEGNAWHDPSRRQRMLEKLVVKREHSPVSVPVAHRTDASPPVDTRPTSRQRRSRRALTAINRELRRQLSDLKGGVQTVDCGTQVHQYAFVTEQGVQTRAPDSTAPRILPRGCILGLPSTRAVPQPTSSAPAVPRTTAPAATLPGASAPDGPKTEHAPESSGPKPLSLSHIECTYDQDYYQRRELLERYQRDVARRGVVQASRREAVPGRFTVGRLVLSLPSWGAKLEDEEFLYKRVHRIVHVRSHTDIRRGYEVCRVRPEFPTFDYRAEKSIESRFLELISAEDYQAAEREYYKYMRRNLAREKISAEWERCSHCDYDSIEDTIDSLVFPDDECRCTVCRGQRDRDSSYDDLYGPDPCAPSCFRCYLSDVQIPPRQLLERHLKRVFDVVLGGLA